VCEDPRASRIADLVLVGVKSYDSELAARLLAPCAGADTIVLSLQNGLENEDVIARAAGLPPLLLAVTYIGSEISSPGVVDYSGAAEIVFGEAGGARSPRAETLSALLTQGGIKHRLSSRVQNVVWDKLAWNAAFNAVTAITRRSIGEVLDGGPGESLIRDTMRETFAVALGLGLDVPVRIDASIEHSRKALPDFRTSMLQDLERGKRLEYDALNGALARLLATLDPHPTGRLSRPPASP